MSGVRWTVHRLPFQRSASVRAPPADDPTATHAVGAGHDTPLNSLAWDGFGVGRIRHRDPSHRAATGRVPDGGRPTAWQEPGAGQDTLLIGPPGGPGTIDQRVPAHASARPPTARQEEAVAQETLSSRSPRPRPGAGTGSHDVPFHRTASGSPGPAAP